MSFHDSILKGGTAKELVKVLLEKSGYVIYPYGYECTYSDVRKKLQKNAYNSPTVRRIKSSPDLLVYDDLKKNVMLVEVKMRTHNKPWIKTDKWKPTRNFGVIQS